MKDHILRLHPHDDFASARDKIGWAQTGRIVLVWPDRGRPLARRLDLVLLHRHADRMGARLGFVTADPEVADLATDLGIPIFPSVEASHLERWAYRRPAPLPERPELPEAALRPPGSEPFAGWPEWALRLLRLEPAARVFLFLAGLAAVVGLSLFLLPSATIALVPASQPLAVTVEILADPAQAEPDPVARVIPARVAEVRVRTTVSAVTSGLQDQPNTPATGSVIFTNRRTGPVTIPRGTVLRTTGGRSVLFATTQAAVTPSEPGGSITVPVQAVEPGLAGNVNAETINAIDGAIAFQLVVVNPQATSGGAVLTVATVTEADQENLREAALEQLRQLGLSTLEGQLGQNEFLAQDTLRIVGQPSETFSHFVGEKADTVTLDMQAVVSATSVNLGGAQNVAIHALEQAVREGETIIPGSVSYASHSTLDSDEDGRVTIALAATGQIMPVIEPAMVRELAQGQPPETASERLRSEFALAAPPEIDIWPEWLDRLPWLGAKINVDIEPRVGN